MFGLPIEEVFIGEIQKDTKLEEGHMGQHVPWKSIWKLAVGACY
jgi:hypothetical protein